jgi:hypothetical protein
MWLKKRQATTTNPALQPCKPIRNLAAVTATISNEGESSDNWVRKSVGSKFFSQYLLRGDEDSLVSIGFRGVNRSRD